MTKNNKKAGENPTFRYALTASTSVVNHRVVKPYLWSLSLFFKMITFICT